MTAQPAPPCPVFAVDDDSLMLRAYEVYLRRRDDLALVGQAKSVDEALGAMAEVEVSVALVDLALGERSGLELLAQIKEQWPAVQVIIVSGYDAFEAQDDALAAGAAAFVCKSDGLSAIIDTIDRICAAP